MLPEPPRRLSQQAASFRECVTGSDSSNDPAELDDQQGVSLRRESQRKGDRRPLRELGPVRLAEHGLEAGLQLRELSPGDAELDPA